MHKNDPDFSFDGFYDKITRLIDKSTNQKPNYILTKCKPWITSAIKKSIAKRDQIYKRFINSKDQNERKEKIFSQLIRLGKRNHYKNFFEKNIKNSKNIWKGVNELIKSKRKTSYMNISLDIKGDLTSDPKCTTEEFNKFFT